MNNKKISLRRCTGCGEMFDKRDMIRVIKTKENEIYSVLSSEAAIYHSLELNYQFGNASINENVQYEDMNIVPLIRYLNNIDYNFGGIK